MQEIQLNPRELLYIASLFDADEFYGISDGFYGMDEAEIASEINNIKKSLNDKEYAEMDFDGNFTVKDEIMNIVDICVHQDKYISFDKVQKSKNLVLRFYIRGNKVIKITGDTEIYSIQETTINCIKSDLLDFVNWGEEKKIAEDDTFIENELLKKIKAMNEFDNPENELKLMGCSNIKSKILYGGLTGESEYYSMLIIDFVAEEQDVSSLIFINSSNGILKLTPDLDAEKEGVILSAVTQCEISQLITDAVAQYIPGAVEDFI